jgi:hypothetical protein
VGRERKALRVECLAVKHRGGFADVVDSSQQAPEDLHLRVRELFRRAATRSGPPVHDN